MVRTEDMTDRELIERIDRHAAAALAEVRTVATRLKTVEENMATQADIDAVTQSLETAFADMAQEWSEAIADIETQAKAAGASIDTSKLQAIASQFTAADAAWRQQLAALPAAPAAPAQGDTAASAGQTGSTPSATGTSATG